MNILIYHIIADVGSQNCLFDPNSTHIFDYKEKQILKINIFRSFGRQRYIENKQSDR